MCNCKTGVPQIHHKCNKNTRMPTSDERLQLPNILRKLRTRLLKQNSDARDSIAENLAFLEIFWHRIKQNSSLNCALDLFLKWRTSIVKLIEVIIEKIHFHVISKKKTVSIRMIYSFADWWVCQSIYAIGFWVTSE